MKSQARIAVVGMTTAYIQHGVYGRCVDSRDNHCLHAVLTLTRNDFFPVSRVRLFIQMYMGINHVNLRLACEDGTVSIGEKTEIMAQGVVVYLFPVAIYKGRYKQQQRALRLMEVCDHHLHNMALLTRSNDYLGACLKHIQDCCAWDKKG